MRRTNDRIGKLVAVRATDRETSRHLRKEWR